MGGRERRARWVAGLLALAAAVAALAAWGVANRGGRPADGSIAQAEVPLEFTASEVVRPQPMAMPLALRFAGPLVAPRTAIVRAKAAGTLLSLAVDEGQRVQAGQTLGRIDLADLSTRVAERTASVQAARARLADAQRQHAANEGLAREQFISPAALESSRAALEAARAQVQAAEAAQASSEWSVAQAALVAPFAGVVGRVAVQRGERLIVEQEVLTVVDLSRLELAGNVPIHEVMHLQPGQALEVEVEGLPGRVPGRVDRIAPAADTGSRAIRVVVRLDNPGERLRAGLFATAHLRIGDEQPRLTLPESALVGSAGQQQVWLIEDGVLKPRVVSAGRRDAESARVEIVGGLGPDATVLAARFDNLRDGRAARVVAPAVVGPAAAASTAAVR